MAKKKATIEKSSNFKPPIVAVLGHVDHGKTTLLDYIRNSRIASREHGSITQHIGAYKVPVGDKEITFIDTPGHEAFTSLRSRGAHVADIALLVVDAVESVKEQTIESIKIIKKAAIPFIVVPNKIDLPNAQPEKVAKDLLRYDVQTEALGGKIASVAISASTGKGVSDLLETILLVAQLKKLDTSEKGSFEGVVVEARKDHGRGSVATVIVQKGTVAVGDDVSVNQAPFRVRAMINDRGKQIKQAGPGDPLEMLGFPDVPTVGATISKGDGATSTDENTHEGKDALSQKKDEEAVLSIFLKADTKGSLEAVEEGLPPVVSIVSSGIGDVTEKDVAFAKTASLVILGFNVRVQGKVQRIAKNEGVRMRMYRIIYKLFEEIADVVVALQQGPQKNILGTAKILQEFTYKDERIAGCQVLEGRVAKGDTAVVLRNEEEIDEPARIVSVRQQKDEVTKVEKGKMCGLRLSRDIDFRVGDVIQSFTLYDL